MTRKDFFRAAALAPAAMAAAPLAHSNARFELSLDTSAGLSVRLRDTRLGTVLASGPYSYSTGTPKWVDAANRGETIALNGTAPGRLEISHEFRVPASKPWIEERISLRNRGPRPLLMPNARCGFVLPLGKSGEAAWNAFRFVAVPYRREPTGGRKQYADYTLGQVLSEPRESRLRANLPVNRSGNVNTPILHATGAIHTTYPDYASEGWCITDGTHGWLVTKYSQEGMEWAVVDRVPLEDGTIALRWGGMAIYEGDPEHGALIPPGGAHAFGVTRLTAFDGGIAEGFYTFRAEMEERGHGCPKGFDPPAHWNELYDNKLWWLPGNGQDEPANRKRYYSLPEIEAEAAKARDYHCEALYLDPGWDTNFASKIWDESRLGRVEDFTAKLRRDYGLSLSLHTPLSGWCNPTSYPREADRMNRDGTRIDRVLCGSSRQYVDETLRRLDALARGGARFFMFDGTIYSGPCWDPNHGHPLPAAREEYASANNRLAKLVHERHPQVLIEMHDQLLGGTVYRHVPTYYGHGGTPHGFDTVWAFELMWDPMTDLVGGHSIALYYYNLAYSLPLYIHIDLRKDNAQALMLWWNISTCRHLGLGGTHSDAAAREAHKRAMADYRRLKPFFASGTFVGIDEQTHAHRHLERRGTVVNCFNLDGKEVKRVVKLDGREHPVRIAPYGHTLLEIGLG